jgi:multidrug resistance efflux pump
MAVGANVRCRARWGHRRSGPGDCALSICPRAANGADPIQAPYRGVASEVRVAEAQEVAAGAELFVLRSDEVRAKHTQLQTLTRDLRTQEDTIVKTEAAHVSEQSKARRLLSSNASWSFAGHMLRRVVTW